MPIDAEKIDETVQNATQVVEDIAQTVAQSARDVVNNAKGDTAATSQTSQGATDVVPDAEDAQRHKGMAMLAYVLFFIPLLTGDAARSPFVKYHTNQGTVLFIAGMIYGIIFSIIQNILGVLVAGSFFVNPILGILLGSLLAIIGVLGLAPLVLMIWGIVNAANGEMKPLPLIGDFTVIK